MLIDSESIYTENDSQILQPIFQNREDFLNYDESNQVISACFDYLQMNLKKKEREGKIASKIVK